MSRVTPIIMWAVVYFDAEGASGFIVASTLRRTRAAAIAEWCLLYPPERRRESWRAERRAGRAKCMRVCIKAWGQR